jgi:hypothetical protein
MTVSDKHSSLLRPYKAYYAGPMCQKYEIVLTEELELTVGQNKLECLSFTVTSTLT